MLRHMELHSHADSVERAVLETIKEGNVRSHYVMKFDYKSCTHRLETWSSFGKSRYTSALRISISVLSYRGQNGNGLLLKKKIVPTTLCSVTAVSFLKGA